MNQDDNGAATQAPTEQEAGSNLPDTEMKEEAPVTVQIEDQIPEEEPQCAQVNPLGFFADTGAQAACSVRVALRVRPLIQKERSERQIVQVNEQAKQVTIGGEKMFTYDACFNSECRQQDVFDLCVKNLVLGCFQGFNATVLAYGQTGSGKTWTMGSGYTIGLTDDQRGIIPRVISLIFDEVENRKKRAEFIVKCSFLEIYNEELIDLLDQNSIQQAAAGSKNINIREEKNGSISVYGLHEERVERADDMAACLDRGTNNRTTASTLMNNNSSRSHAIFTITIEQHQIDDLYQGGDAAASGDAGQLDESAGATGAARPDEFMVAKFHFVDLAGSERAKKTGASGATLKEGININKSLLVLGNVISALSEEGKKGNFVPYRDSKLTRILQDSLGGNSRTSMIACVSPAESNFDETLNTLNYASRARRIKNKPKVNRDPNSALIAELRQQCYELQKEALRFRQLLIQNEIEFKVGIELPSDEELAKRESQAAATGVPPMAAPRQPVEFGMSGQEIRALEDEIKKLKIECGAKDKQVKSQEVLNENLQSQLNNAKIENYSLAQERDSMRLQIDQLNQTLDNLNLKEQVYTALQTTFSIDPEDKLHGLDGTTILQEYQQQLNDLKKDVDSKSLQIATLQADSESLLKQSEEDAKVLEKQSQELEKLKRMNAKLQKENVTLQNDARKGPSVSNPVDRRRQGVGLNRGVNSATNRANSNNARREQLKALIPSKERDKLATDFEKELEDKMKTFQDKYLNDLSASLSEQLFNINKAAQEKRKQTIGQSFVEPQGSRQAFNASLLGGFQFGQKKEVKGLESPRANAPTPKKGLSAFGGVGAAASVLLPSAFLMKEKSVRPNLNINTMDATAEPVNKLSVVQDLESVLECDTIKDEVSVRTPAEAPNNSVVFQNVEEGPEDQDDMLELLRKSVAKRASVLSRSSTASAAAAGVKAPGQDVEIVRVTDDQDMADEPAVVVEDDDSDENKVMQPSQPVIIAPDLPIMIEQEQDQDMHVEEGAPLVVEDEDDDDDAVVAIEEADFDEFEAVQIANEPLPEEETERQKHESLIEEMNGDLFEKEKLLDAIKNQQRKMQEDLMSMMKDQYAAKVQQLQSEMTALANQQLEQGKDGGLSAAQKKKLEDQYKTKYAQLEKELKEARAKNQQQSVAKRQVDTQSSKIKSLESEIQKMRSAKISAQRKWKEQSDKYSKLRKDKADEVLKLKKNNLMKEKEIDRLKKEQKRKELVHKRKQEELKVMHAQRKMTLAKKNDASKMRRAKHNVDAVEVAKCVGQAVNKMVDMFDAQEEMVKQNVVLQEVQEQIDGEVDHLANTRLIKDKLLVKKYMLENAEELEHGEILNVEMDIENVELQCEQLQQNVDSMQERADYITAQISELTTIQMKAAQGVEMFLKDLAEQNLSSQEGVHAVIDCFFSLLRDAAVAKRRVEKELDKTLGELEDTQKERDDQRRGFEAMERVQLQKVQTLEVECQQRAAMLLQLQEQIQNGVENRDPSKLIETKMLNARQAIQKQKDDQINESMMFQKKRVAQLEKDIQELDNSKLLVENKLKMALQEKEQQKSVVSQLRSQLKVLNDLNKDISMRNAIQNTYNLNVVAVQAPLGTATDSQQQQQQTMHQTTQQTKTSLYDRRNGVKQQKQALATKRGNVYSSNPYSSVPAGTKAPNSETMTKHAASARKAMPRAKVIAFDNGDDLNYDGTPEAKPFRIDDNDDQSGTSSVMRAYADDAVSQQSSVRMSEGSKKSINSDSSYTSFERVLRNQNSARGRLPKGVGARKQSHQLLGHTALQQPAVFDRLTRNSSRGVAGVGARRATHQVQGGTGAQIVQAPAHANNYFAQQRTSMYSSARYARKLDRGGSMYTKGGLGRMVDEDTAGKWRIVSTINDSHKHSINAIECIDNQVYTTSWRCMRVWDINTGGKIHDLKAHTGAIKCAKYSGQQGVFATAGDKSDKCVHLWDLTSMQPVVSLSGHRGDVRALEFSPSGFHLFSGGPGGMLVWDLRNTDTPMERLEKQMDVFTLKTVDSHLFMGCLNHSIIPVGMNLHEGGSFAEQACQPIDNSHLDVVTSIAALQLARGQQVLFSASKDKYMRAWQIPSAQQQLDEYSSPSFMPIKNLEVKDAHSGEINVLQESVDQKCIYSGSKDGLVRVWSVAGDLEESKEGEELLLDPADELQPLDPIRGSSDMMSEMQHMQQVGQLMAQGCSVLAIKAINVGSSQGLIYGGTDRTLRICKSIENVD